MGSREGKQRCSTVLSRGGWLSFQSCAPNFFNPLILQIHPLLPVLPIPQLSEMSRLLSALDSGDLYLSKRGHNICSNVIILGCPQERPSVLKKNHFNLSTDHSANPLLSDNNAILRWLEGSNSIFQSHGKPCNYANLRSCQQTGTRKGSKCIHLTDIFKVTPPGRRISCGLAH